MSAENSQCGSAKARYDALKSSRENYLTRARDAATLTMPYLVPPLGFNSAMQLPTPYQSLGAQGVRNLASKLLLALFPTNTTFFKYEIDDFLLEQLTQQKGMRGEVELAMSRRERAIMVEMNKALLRPAMSTGHQHLLVTGNYLLHVPEKGRVRGFGLTQYVVRRDPTGNLLELVIEENLSVDTLPMKARGAIKQNALVMRPQQEAKDSHEGTGTKPSCLYTRVYLGDDDMWYVYQECEGVRIPDSDGTYPKDACPWIPLRWSTQPGEDYGRSYVEEFLGDLDSLEGLSQTLVEGIAAAARIVFFVKPNGVTRAKVVANARTGDTEIGNAEDVTVLQAANKSADFQTAQKQAETIASRIARAFMLNTSVQRNAERVTAEEIRFMAGDLDDALGGVYTLLAAEAQLPIVLLFERRMQKSRKVPPLPKGVAEPTITTGLEAIGRGVDLQNIKRWVTDVLQVVGPDIAFKYVKPAEFLKRSAAGYGIDTEGLMRSEEEVAQAEQQQQLAGMVNQLGPDVIKAGAGITQASIANQSEQGTQT